MNFFNLWTFSFTYSFTPSSASICRNVTEICIGTLLYPVRNNVSLNFESQRLKFLTGFIIYCSLFIVHRFLNHFPPFARGQYLHHFTVFRNRPPGNMNVSLLQHLNQLLIAVRFPRVLPANDLLQQTLDASGGHRLPLYGGDTGVEKDF